MQSTSTTEHAMQTARTYHSRSMPEYRLNWDGYSPANAAALAEGRDAHQSPVSDTEMFRRFETCDDGERFYIIEIPPTRAYPLNWIDGATTRGGAWMQARTQRLPVSFVALSASESRDIGVVFDLGEYLQREYRGYCSQGRADSDAAFYAPLSYESWLAHEGQRIIEKETTHA